jgi:membrane protease YdiL (CAAX protease family)
MDESPKNHPPNRDGSTRVIRALFSVSAQAFFHSLGWKGKVSARYRQPTLKKRGLPGWLSLLFVGIWLFQSFYNSRHLVEELAEASRNPGGDVLFLPEDAFQVLEKVSPALDDEERKDLVQSLEVDLMTFRFIRKGGREVPSGEEVLAHFERKGLEGFEIYSGELRHGLRDLREEERGILGQRLGWLILAALLAGVFMPMAIKMRQLAETSDRLEWLYCLPIRGRELLLGQFVSLGVLRPLALILWWPLFTELLIFAGSEVWTAAAYAFLLMIMISVAVSGFELLLDQWIRGRAAASVQRNAQMVCGLLGLLCLYLLLAAGISGARALPWIDWLTFHGLGSVGAWAAHLFFEGGWILFAAVTGMTVVIGFGGYLSAARLLREGLLSGHSHLTGSRKKQKGGIKPGNLTKFEGLLLWRDRTLATQVIFVPLMLIGYQWLVNPVRADGFSPQAMAAMVYGCGVYGCLVTSQQLLLSESKGIWLYFNLPAPISEVFSRRERFWRGVSTTIASGLLLVLVGISGGVALHEAPRLLVALLGVSVMGRMVSGILMGKPEMPDLAAGEKPKVRYGAIYGVMTLAGGFGALLWHGDLWSLLAGLVIFWFLGTALWQRRKVSFRYLLEPLEKEPPSWGVDDGLWAVLVFFVAQIFAALILGQSAIGLGEVVLVSFVAGGVAALLFSARRRRAKGIDLPGFPAASKVWSSWWKELLGLTAVCLVVAYGWGWILQFFDGDSSAEAMEWDGWILVLLAVVAAPLLEECLFRGFLCRTMLAFWSERQAVLASALIFAVLHPGTSFPPVFLVGCATALLFLRTRSIWPGVILHALYNAGVLLPFLLAS